MPLYVAVRIIDTVRVRKKKRNAVIQIITLKDLVVAGVTDSNKNILYFNSITGKMIHYFIVFNDSFHLKQKMKTDVFPCVKV